MTTRRTSAARVLVAEADGDFAEAISQALEADGFEVVRSSSLPHARDLLLGGSIDVLLTDVELGGESTEVLLNELAGLASAPPTALCSAALDAPEMAGRFGIGFVQQPFTLGGLTSVVRETLGAAQRPSRGSSARDSVDEETAAGSGG